MAPTGRGRSRKRGNTRMDAALDAMTPLGFKAKCVRQTVKELLKVYGGDDGWVFIEEAAYKLLIDTILDNQKNASPERLLLKDVSQDDARSADVETSIVGPSCRVVEPGGSAIEAANTVLLTTAGVALDPVSHGTEALDFQAETNEAGAKDDSIPAIVEESRRISKDLANIEDSQTDKCLCVKDSEIDKDPANTIIKSSKAAGFVAPRKRRPYHGWIYDGDENEDLMCLTPEPLPIAQETLIRRVA